MAQEYLYDVFVSYRHNPPVLTWMKNHFYPLLEQRLPDCMPVDHETSIFIDWDIEKGASWPQKLSGALRRSRCLLCVWSADYFRSRWCMAEWRTMRERERLAGFRTEQNSQGLIYPVIFSDGEHFPAEAQAIQYRDLRKWNYPQPVFKDTVGILELDQAVQELCQELAPMVLRAPPWQDSWPVITPKVAPGVRFGVPRL